MIGSRISLNATDNDGKVGTYHTYLTYIDPHIQEYIAEQEELNSITPTKWTLLGGYLGFLAFHKVAIDKVVKIGGYSVTRSMMTIACSAVGYLFGSWKHQHDMREIYMRGLHNTETVPLWKNPLHALNPDRAYIELDDKDNFLPTPFHAGLNAENAAFMVPDLIMGPVRHPPKPVRRELKFEEKA